MRDRAADPISQRFEQSTTDKKKVDALQAHFRVINPFCPLPSAFCLS